MSNRIVANHFARFFLVIVLLIGISVQAADEDDLRRGQLHRTAPMVVSNHVDTGDDNRTARGIYNNICTANLHPRDGARSFLALTVQPLPAAGTRKIHDLNVVFLI